MQHRIARRSAGLAIVLAVLVLVLVELALQARAQQRTGASVFNLLRGETTYVEDVRLGVRVLRRSSVLRGTKQTLATNRYGLRGDDFEPVPTAGERRIAMLGASTIMGTYAPTNRETSSAVLQELLNDGSEAGAFRVVNAGLNGTTLQAQTQVLTRLLPDLGIRLVVWYPGVNDIGCTSPASSSPSSSVRLPWPAIPQWVLTSDLIVKNTAPLRHKNAAPSQQLRPDFDPAAAHDQVERGVQSARRAGLSVVLVTSATSFRTDMPDEMISRRAASALFFRPCYTGPELAQAIDAFNAMLRQVAGEQGLPLIDAARVLPPDPALFGDATHFSVAGEQAFAALLAAELRRGGLLADGTAR